MISVFLKEKEREKENSLYISFKRKKTKTKLKMTKYLRDSSKDVGKKGKKGKLKEQRKSSKV